MFTYSTVTSHKCEINAIVIIMFGSNLKSFVFPSEFLCCTP